MNVMFLLIPMALLFAFGFLMAFLWAVRKGQFDDLETPKHQILLDLEMKKTDEVLHE